METNWKRSIDQTLQSTRATLRRLQERHAHYDVAKKRVDEALGAPPALATTTASGEPSAAAPVQGRGAADGARDAPTSAPHSIPAEPRAASPLLGRWHGDSAASIPPPLPPSWAGAATASFSPSAPRRHPDGDGTNISSSVLLWDSYAFAPSTPKELVDAFRVMKAQLKGLAVELELERAVRADGQRELASGNARRIQELARAVELVQEENAFLRESVRALETRSAFAPSGGGGANSRYLDAAGGSRLQHPFPHDNGSFSPLGEAKSTFLGQSYTAVETGCTSPADERLRQRFADLEGRIQRQQSLLDDRHGRVDSLLKDLVDAKVGTEVERMRSIAREAAREATEDLVRVRLSAVQSMFHDELRAVLDQTGVTGEVTRTTERLLHQRQREWEGKWATLQETVAEMQGRLAGTDALAERVAEGERKVTSGLLTVESELAAVQRSVQETHLHLSQTTAAALESTRVELTTLVQRQTEQHQHQLQQQGYLIREQDVRRMLEGVVGPLESRLEAVENTVRRARESQEEWQRQATRAAAETAADMARHTEAMADLQRALDAHASQSAALRVDVASCQAQGKSTAASLEEVSQLASDAMGLAKRLQERYDEHSTRLEVQVRRLTQGQDTVKERVQSLSAEKEALTDRMGELDDAVRTVTSSLPRTVQPLAAKVESLQQVVNQTCLPTLDSVQVTLTECTARVQQMQDSRRHQDQQVAHQLSDVRKDMESRVSETEARLRHDLDESQMQTTRQVDALRTKVSAQITSSLQTLSTASQEHVEALGARVAALEATAETMRTEAEVAAATAAARPPATTVETLAELHEAGRQAMPATPSHPEVVVDAVTLEMTKTLLSEERRWTLQRIEAAEQREAERLQQEAQGLREEQAEMRKHLSGLAQQRASEVQGQLSRMEITAREQAAATRERLAEVEQHTSSRVTAGHERMKELLSPSRLVSALISDDDSLMQLATSLQPKLSSSGETIAALAQLRTALRAIEQQQQQQHTLAAAAREDGERTEGGVEGTGAGVAASGAQEAAVSALLLSRIAALEESAEHSLQQLRKQCQETKASALACHTRVEDAVPSLQLRLSAVEASSRELLESHAGVSGLIQQRLQAALQSFRSEYTETLQPLEATLRRLQERCGTLGTSHEQLSEQLGRQGRDVAKNQEALDTARAALAGLQTQVNTQQDMLLREYLHPMQEHLARVDREVQDAKERLLTTQVRSPPAAVGEDEGGGGGGGGESDGARIEEMLGPIVTRLEVLEGFADGIESSGEAGLQATADALVGLRDGLHQCLDKAADYLRNDRWALGIVAEDVVVAADVAPAPLPRLDALDDLFLFLLSQISNIHSALGTLQQNAVATLELIQQQELDVLAIPLLQEAVCHLSEQMKPIAAATGVVDPQVFTVDVGQLSERDKEDAPRAQMGTAERHSSSR